MSLGDLVYSLFVIVIMSLFFIPMFSVYVIADTLRQRIFLGVIHFLMGALVIFLCVVVALEFNMLDRVEKKVEVKIVTEEEYQIKCDCCHKVIKTFPTETEKSTINSYLDTTKFRIGCHRIFGDMSSDYHDAFDLCYDCQEVIRDGIREAFHTLSERAKRRNK